MRLAFVLVFKLLLTLTKVPPDTWCGGLNRLHIPLVQFLFTAPSLEQHGRWHRQGQCPFGAILSALWLLPRSMDVESAAELGFDSYPLKICVRPFGCETVARRPEAFELGWVHENLR